MTQDKKLYKRDERLYKFIEAGGSFSQACKKFGLKARSSAHKAYWRTKKRLEKEKCNQ